MEFSIIDFMVGFLLVSSIVHIAMAKAKISFPSVFGRTAKANNIHGILLAFVAVDIYFFSYGFNTTINNGVLIGAVDFIICYVLFGGFLHRRFKIQPLAQVHH